MGRGILQGQLLGEGGMTIRSYIEPLTPFPSPVPKRFNQRRELSEQNKTHERASDSTMRFHQCIENRLYELP